MLNKVLRDKKHPNQTQIKGENMRVKVASPDRFGIANNKPTETSNLSSATRLLWLF